ncbi:MAG: twin-arginine translocation signal domain-containing protein, partial [Coriobacteriales bacterium]|nr:twin-arginine translocation signal domain-containing protein [Coriobacteriales bacterium]
MTRRSFLAFCGTVAAAIGIEGITEVEVAQAIEEKLLIGKAEGALLPVIWMELGSCTGCTESLAQADDPDPATIIMEYISLNYTETLGAGAGYSLEEAREETIKHADGKYVLVIEGAVMTACDGYALTVGDGPDHKPIPVCTPDGPLAEACKHAAA